MSTDEDTLREVLDRARLLDLIARYQESIDFKHWDVLHGCLTEDAVCDYVGMKELFDLPGTTEGRDEIIDWLRNAVDPFETRHYLTNHVVTVTGDRAHVGCYVLARGRETHEGVYEFEAVRAADGWRLRRVVLDHVRYPPGVVEKLLAQRYERGD